MELIPRLPDEISRECLLRVPYKWHYKLKTVCRSWEAVVKSPRFYEARKLAGTTEQCVCLVQALPLAGDSVEDKRYRAPAYGITVYDPLQGSWDRLPPVPQFCEGIPLFCQCVTVKEKLVMIGGWHPSNWEATNSVFIYDFCSAEWRRGADMPSVRSFFACAASADGRIYVAGGHDDNKNALRVAEVYHVEADEWESLPPMSHERDECHGVFLDGKFHVISGYATESQGAFERSAEVFDPRAGTWTRSENMWTVGGCPRSCVAAFGQLYFFRRNEVLLYSARENAWSAVDSLPEGVSVAPCATVWRDRIFVTGSAQNGGEQVSYMFEPAGRSGDLGPGRWVPVDRPQSFVGFVQSAATVEI